MTEVTEKEYHAKEREMKRYEEKKEKYEKEIGNLDDEISELDKAIERMTIVYQDFKRQVNDFDKTLNQKSEFTGNQYDTLIAGEGNNHLSVAKDLQGRINAALDQLEFLRTEKKNQRYERWGSLGEVVQYFNYLKTWLKTHLFNN